MPSSIGDRIERNKIYPESPWEWYGEQDIISMVAQTPKPLESWIPTEGVNYLYENVSHLTWVYADGAEPSTYVDLINALEVGECEFADLTPKYDGCQYTIGFGESSAMSNVLDVHKDFGTMQYKESRRIAVRQPDGGVALQTADNAQFEVSLAVHNYQQHLNIDLINGTRADNPKMWSDGLLEVISNGYVSGKKVSGSETGCDFTNPIVRDGSMIPSIEAFLIDLRMQIRRLKKRGELIGMPINFTNGDTVILMPGAMWDALLDHIAWGANFPAPAANYVGAHTIEMVEDRRARYRTGGLGYGTLPVDGMNIPVIVVDELGINSGNKMVSDVLVLTRRAGGQEILTRQFLDWSQLRTPEAQDNVEISANGFFRNGWLKYNETCFRWFIESQSRLVTRMNALQVRYTSVQIPITAGYDIKSNAYDANFYVSSLGAGL